MSESAVRVLHVDDEPKVGDLTATYLEREGDQFSVETATSATEGLGSIRDRPPDCVVSDHNMPKMDGVEFLEAVRTEYPDLPFILFTVKGSETVASDAIATGVTDYLQKETGTEQYELLANRIRNAVQARREAARADRQEQLMRLTEFAGKTGGFELHTETGELLLTDGSHRLLDLPAEADLSLEEAIDLYHPDDRAEIRQTIARARRTGEQQLGTWRLQPRDGEELVLDVTFSPAKNDGDAEILRGAAHDVTDRKERKRELHRARDLMATMEELAEAGAWQYDPAADRLMLTAGAERFYEPAPNSDPTLEAALELVKPDDRDRLRDRFETCLESGEPYEIDVRRSRVDGGERWITVHGERVDTGEDHSVLRGYFQDITDRKERERQLNREREA